MNNTDIKSVKKKGTGRKKTTGEGSLDVFQCDNKDNGNVPMANTNSSPRASAQPKDSCSQVKNPCVLNGKCLSCPFNGDIINETIVCFKCSHMYHATCRDKRGQLTGKSICSKPFLPKFRALSNHFGDDKNRWGNFLYICGVCKMEVVNDDELTSKCDVALQNSPFLHTKETQSQSPTLVTSESQTLMSGNVHEFSFNSINSDVNVCDSIHDDSNEIVDDLNVSGTNTTLDCTDVIDDIKTLTKLNEEVLANIKSLQKLSNDHANTFGKQIDDIKETLKSTSHSVKYTQNVPNELLDSSQPISQPIKPPFSFNFDPEKCKPYKGLHLNLLDNEHFDKLTDFLDKSNNFKTISSKNNNSSRDVSYYGEFRYRYGAIQHEANAIPDVIQPIVDKISEMYPKTIINSCLVTRYRNGNSSCPQHSDNEPFIAPCSDIFTLSVGCERSMLFNSVSNTSTDISLPNNSLLAFSRSSQEFWKHEIPCCETGAVRYSLTFRQLAPYYANSTLIVGDSNTEYLKFGSGRNKFGVWMPGCREKAGRIKDLPNPEDLDFPYRNLVVHTGINDLRATNHLPIPVLMNNLKDKCLALSSKFPKMKVHISMLLPTKDPGLNSMVSEMNMRIKNFASEHTGIFVISQHNLADSSGKLSSNLGRHNNDGKPVMFDTVHLGSKGISLFCLNIKNCIIKRRDINAKTDDSNINQSLNDNKYPYWKPNPGYRPARYSPPQHQYPWTGDHGENFPVRSFQPFLNNDLHYEYQS